MRRRLFLSPLSLLLLAFAFSPLSSRAAAPLRPSPVPAAGLSGWTFLHAWWGRFAAMVPSLGSTEVREGRAASKDSAVWNKEGGSWDPNGAPRPASTPLLPAGEPRGEGDSSGRP